MQRIGRRVGLLFVALLVPLLLLNATQAGEERFDYDPLGRLIRVIDDQNRVTEYVYDAAGNLLEVITTGTAVAPTITSIGPDQLRRGESKQITVTGDGFIGARLGVADPGLSITDAIISRSEIKFTLTASDAAVLGPQPITLNNAAGSTTAAVTVNPVLPKINIVPAPLAIPPDSTARQFTIHLSSPDNIDHSFALSVSDPSIITLTPTDIVIPVGQTEASANIAGLKAGLAKIILTSNTLGVSKAPVFVTSEFKGISTSYGAVVGVVVEQPPVPKPAQTLTPFSAPHMGVVLGSHIYSVNPKAVVANAETSELRIYGKALNEVTDLSVRPAEGVTLGSFTIEPDGTMITVPITVVSEAAMGVRQLVLTAGTLTIPTSRPDADRILIAPPPPEITSVDPLFGVPGTPVQTLVIRGRHFKNIESIQLSPSEGIAVDASPSVNAEGTVISVRLAIAPSAVIGPRVVTVVTASGSSSVVAAAANTFTVVNEVQDNHTPISAAAVGVVKEVASMPVSATYGFYSSQLGITVGSVVTGVTPLAESIGESFTMTISGHELQDVTSVEFFPNTGITVGAPTVAADGKSLTVAVALAADAPLTLRTLRVKAGTTLLPPAPISATQFRVTAPLPLMNSMSPIILQVGQPLATLTIRGKNFQNTQSVRVLPADGITLGALTVNATNTEITTSISAAADAALGPRVVVVETLAGATSATAAAENTLTLSSTAGDTYSSLLARAVGVLVQQEQTAPVENPYGGITASIVGVHLVQTPPAPTPQAVSLNGAQLGVAVGPVARSVGPAGLVQGISGEMITVQGYGLEAVTAVSAYPAAGLTFGTPSVSIDGAQLTVTVDVAADAQLGPRELVLSTTNEKLLFTQPAASHFSIASGVPHLDSITPILGNQDSIVTLTMRGSHLSNILEVAALPADGITFVPDTLTWNTAGTEANVKFVIAPDAPLGARVIQVITPGGSSVGDPIPANTFTVYPP